jgi:seryl-tRNA synthetase
MRGSDLINFNRLEDKIRELLEAVSRLSQENEELSGNLKKYPDENVVETYLMRISELEQELQELKKENKRLKEREKLIKNKVERLAVKLEKIEI